MTRIIKPALVLATLLSIFISFSSQQINFCSLNSQALTPQPNNWRTAEIWTCSLPGVSPFPTGNADAYMNISGNASVVLDGDSLIINDLILGGGNGYKTLKVATTLSASPLIVQSRGILDADLGSGMLTGSQRFDILSGGKFTWRSGSIVSDAPWNIFSGATVNLVPSATDTVFTLDRNTNSNGTITIPQTTLSLARTFVSYGTITTTGSTTFQASTPNAALRVTTISFSMDTSQTCTFDVNTIFDKPISLASGTISVTRNSSLNANLYIGVDGIFTFGTGPFKVSNVTNDGAFTWTEGNLQLNRASFINNGAASFLSTGPNARLFALDQASMFNNTNAVTIPNTLTFQSVSVINSGTFNAGNQINIPNITFIGGSLGGEGGSYNVTSNFAWSGGLIGASLVAKGTISITDGGLSLKEIYGPAVVTLNATVGAATMTNTNITLYNAGQLMNGNLIGFSGALITVFPDHTGSFINNGRIYGTLSLNGVDFTNNNQFGAVFGSSNPVTTMNAKGGSVTFSDSSEVYLDVYSIDMRSNIVVDAPNLNLGGNLTVRLRRAFIAGTSTTVRLLTYSATTTLNNNFNNVIIDQSDWDNAQSCTGVNFNLDQQRRTGTLSFTGCSITPPPPPPGGNTAKSTNKTTVILIVLFVAGLIALAVGCFAWCKKKYKKKPWDRLRDDRF